MIDLTKMDVAADAAIAACETAPFMVRPYLKPLIAFVHETRSVIHQLNAAGGSPGNIEEEAKS